MRVVKMHGVGNDFVLINNFEAGLQREQLPKLARTLCDRKKGIGADGLILADASNQADFRMRFYNRDGSEGEMCGNGARCVARLAYESGLAASEMSFESLAGLVKAWRVAADLYQIELPNPSVIQSQTLHRETAPTEADYVELGQPGVPHLCVELDFQGLPENKLRELGRNLRHDQSLHKGANVNFYQLQSNADIQCMTFERGVEDFTLACGTGAASVVLSLAAKASKWRNREVTLHVPGGQLMVKTVWCGESVQQVLLIGEVIRVFETNWENKNV